MAHFDPGSPHEQTSTQQLIQEIGSEIHRILKGCKEKGNCSAGSYRHRRKSIVSEEEEKEEKQIDIEEDCYSGLGDGAGTASIFSELEDSFDPLGSARSDLPSPYEVWQRAQPKEVSSRVYHPVLSRQEIDDISERLYCISAKQQEKIERKRLEQEQRELEALSFTPTINRRSKKLVNGSFASIQERTKEFLKEKEAKLMRQRERLREEEMQEVKAKPDVLKSTRWQPRVAQKYIKSTGSSGAEAQDDYHLTFSPAITQKSCQIVAKAEKEGRRRPVWEPCHQRANRTSTESDNTSSFIPRINTRSRSLSRPGKDVYDRLYSIRKQSVVGKERKVKEKRQAVVYKRKYLFILEKLKEVS